MINQARRDAGLNTLRSLDSLVSAARDHGQDMTCNGLYGHTSSDGTRAWERIGLYAHGIEACNGCVQSTYDLTTDLLLQGKLTTEGFITHRFPLGQWRQAVRTATDKRSGAIKVVLDYRTEA